jgi:hypothetical protein
MDDQDADVADGDTRLGDDDGDVNGAEDAFGDVDADEENYTKPPTMEEIQALSIATTDWTVDALMSLHRRNQIEMDPSFQRRSAWDGPKRTRFIESLILNLPIPPVVLAEQMVDGGRSYIVLDGKQRLSTIFAFLSNGLRLPRVPQEAVIEGLEGKFFDKDPSIAETYRELLLTTTIRTVVVRSWKRPDLLSLIFLRLNTGTKPLSSQELVSGLSI